MDPGDCLCVSTAEAFLRMDCRLHAKVHHIRKRLLPFIGFWGGEGRGGEMPAASHYVSVRNSVREAAASLERGKCVRMSADIYTPNTHPFLYR